MGQIRGKKVSFCTTNLRTNVSDAEIERAHRLGRYRADKTCPIAMKFAHHNDKSNILQSSWQLKDTSFFIREDCSACMRVARQKLYAFGQRSNAVFKICFDKLTIDKKHYV